MSTKKKAADITAVVLETIENGKKTINQARSDFGLEPIDDPTADELLKRE
ncbi:hypothetical protein WJ0W_005778 [Paenibacillus melissococcoides]|uniref:Uncharacterized protein n=1 Tax=Paenibacillus melissococcoides TaxID=2912268 RepID=A0ABM9G9D6_9BACL|nr:MULTISPECIES: hypothetical protein [Paenibacillus]MEB9896787.1 hypothetical protein [Bacillus cereus]CAH8248594.1 hypothetical protein WJ0W_005778 [Paenibacillus melissococcoides]CAH8714303.1 hypothetical protein WDD9_003834 [Paenibacillus melissococcoides]CAH8719930.1 hypothetical protein HTL2_005773 [Paenibacillus melissococcoides]GIO79576.1 hypothetical protein J6TS7_31860 [Paenibacillus dendritiformis]